MSEKTHLYLASDLTGMVFKFNETTGKVEGSAKFQPHGFDFVYEMKVLHRLQFDGPVDDVILVLEVGAQTSPKTHLVMLLDIRDRNDALLTLVSKSKLPRTFKKWTDINDEPDLVATIGDAIVAQYTLNKDASGWKEIA